MEQVKTSTEELKKIKPAIDQLQLASARLEPGFAALASARAELFKSIRSVLVEAGATSEYLAKFDRQVEQ